MSSRPRWLRVAAGALAGLASLAAQEVRGRVELESGIAFEAELRGSEPRHGARYVAPATGQLYVGLSCDLAELELRVEDGQGRVVGSARGRRALVQLPVNAGQAFDLHVEAAALERATGFSLRASVAASTPEIDAVVAGARELLELVETHLAQAEVGDARSRLRDCLATLSADPAVRRSKSGARAVADMVAPAEDVGEIELELQATRWTAEFYERHYPAGHPTVQVARLNLASSLTQAGAMDEAIGLTDLVIADFLAYLPEEHLRVQEARVAYAINLGYTDRADEARIMLERALAIQEQQLPEDDPVLFDTRRALAANLIRLGDLVAAGELLETVLEHQLREFPDDANHVQITRMDLAVVRRQLGDVHGARTLQERVLDIYSAKLPDDHPELLVVRNNLAVVRYIQGDLLGARALFAKVVEVAERTRPPGDAIIMTGRWNLASLLDHTGELERARALYERLIDEARGRSTLASDVVRGKAGLARLAFNAGDVGEAIRLYAEILEVYERTLSEHHFEVSVTRASLGICLDYLGEHEQAIEIHERVLELREQAYPHASDFLMPARHNVLCSSAALGDRERSGEMLDALVRDTLAGLRAAAERLSVREAEAAAARRLSNIGLFSVLNALRGPGPLEPFAELEDEAFELVETARGIGVAALRCRRAASDERHRGAVESAQAAVASASREVAELAWAATQPERLREAVLVKGRAERELRAALAAAFDGTDVLPRLTPERVAGGLGENEVAVGYWTYDQDTSRDDERLGSTTERALLAFVLEPDGRLQRVELGAMRAVEQAVQDWREALGVAPGRAPSTSADQTERRRLGVRLRELVVDPVRERAPRAQRWIVALDEVLHLFPLDALPLDEGALGDAIEINVRPTLAELARAPRPIDGPPGLVAMGGIDYQAPARLPADAGLADRRALAPLAAATRGGLSAGFRELPATEGEVLGIGAMFEQAFGVGAGTTLLFGEEATKRALVGASGEARYLHLATHGFFARGVVDAAIRDRAEDARSYGGSWPSSLEEDVRGFSPMVLCGLALAGANRSDLYGRLPGVITAEELGALDLTGCELAVLSACDTHVGEMDRAGQGVASLQKALHAAGARTVVTSLWKVSDESARALMLEFYRGIWLDGLPKARALWRAKSKLRAERVPLRDWAGWVLSGEAR